MSRSNEKYPISSYTIVSNRTDCRHLEMTGSDKGTYSEAFIVMESHRALLAMLLACSLLLTACGGGGGGSTSTPPAPAAETPVPVEPLPEEPEEPVPDNPSPEPEPLPRQDPGLLKRATSDEELVEKLVEGMAQNQIALSPLSFVDFSPAPPAPEVAVDGTLEDFSTTNLQEVGVDEADHAKYDGEILYVAEYVRVESASDDGSVQASSSFIPPTPVAYKPVIRMYRTEPQTATVTEAGTLELTEDDREANIYIRGEDDNKQLLTLSKNNTIPYWAAFSDYTYWQSKVVQVRAWNVADPQAPVQQFSWDIEGALLTSRRVANTLYVVTRFTPEVEGLVRYPSTEEEVQSNIELLQNANAADLLPSYTRDGVTSEPLLSGADCYVPNDDFEGAERLASGGSLVTITAIDLDAPDNSTSICLNGFASGFYMSYQSLYLTTNTANDTTLIHKVTLNYGRPEYRGSGEVHGYLGTSNPSFMMSESGSDLRVVSSVWGNQVFPLPVMPASDEQAEPEVVEEVFGEHQLTILRENSSIAQLDRIARLPNKERQEHIGKPGEAIYAARFLGDRLYIVTFRTIDPLYTIDVSDPVDPQITGELEIPGFSSILQSLGEGLLLGVGYEASLQPAVLQGVKVALFDVANPAQPIELSSHVIGRRGSQSPAADDYHALSLLKTDSGYRLALPVQRNETQRGVGSSDPFAYYDWTDSALYQFSVDTASGTLTQQGRLLSAVSSADVPYPLRTLAQSRSFIHDGAVYLYIPNNGGILSGMWGQ